MSAKWWWPWHRAKKTAPPRRGGNGGTAEARRALEQAQADLREAKQMAAQNQPKIETLRRINEENHFAAWAWKVFSEDGRSR